ncbi:vascular-related unknown protein 1-like isoform X2 [Prosopis cineraria]|uniref:vascular-related unknown protein 1-like isoform X2 n=1 Tax=Prosopis cineraria TaxID=364024 RepID=UPI0024106F6E|nr:vascular-related unknown protein 1-like isoform X2 [Prosopis cineraria]
MSSISRAPSLSEVADEESGWTTYFEDFFNGGDEEFSGIKNGKKRLSFKKRKKDRATMVDDALEDTASSPLNSPKVLHENRSDKPKRMEDIRLSEEKRSISGEGEAKKEMGFMGRESDYTELKKRGLCLVPLSVVVNYFR